MDSCTKGSSTIVSITVTSSLISKPVAQFPLSVFPRQGGYSNQRSSIHKFTSLQPLSCPHPQKNNTRQSDFTVNGKRNCNIISRGRYTKGKRSCHNEMSRPQAKDEESYAFVFPAIFDKERHFTKHNV